MKKGNSESNVSDVLGGMLNILGLKIDLGELLSSSGNVQEQLEELREKLKQAGGKETMGDEEWKAGGITISGHLRTRGILGDREYHIGTVEPVTSRKGREKAPETSEVVEPPVDVFHEAGEIVVVAEVPGVQLADLELKLKDSTLSIATKPGTRRNYRKEVALPSKVDKSSLKATCRNGILEIHLKKRAK